jgi:hypothetical protein
VNPTEQSDTPGIVVGPSRHPPSCPNKAPGVDVLKDTRPLGVSAPPTSATVAVHVVAADTATGDGEHVTLVTLARRPTLTSVCSVCSGPPKSSTVTWAV